MLTRCDLGCALSTIISLAISLLKRKQSGQGFDRKKIDQKIKYQALFPDSTASTLLAISALPPTLVDSTASALLTITAHPPVLTDVCALAAITGASCQKLGVVLI